MGQYPDGLRGPLIIHDPDDPYRDQYDGDIVLTVSDWYVCQGSCIELNRSSMLKNLLQVPP
jgi:iron transport multicopper oxidase